MTDAAKPRWLYGRILVVAAIVISTVFLAKISYDAASAIGNVIYGRIAAVYETR